MSIIVKSILISILFFTGVAIAAPVNVETEERVRYTSSLNAMAMVIMNWYGNLILSPEQIVFKPTSAEWDDYRKHYPQQITQLQIMSTDVRKLDNGNLYRFVVNTQIAYENAEGAHSQTMRDIFTFKVPLLAQPTIELIVEEEVEQVENIPEPAFNRSHYKAREFAYAWLAHLDGVAGDSTVTQLFSDAHYAFKIGSDTEQGTVESVMNKRKQYLAHGGHRLHSLDVVFNDSNPEQVTLELIIEWKGVNQAGKPVLAKIHQEIKAEIQKNGIWRMDTIKEKHVLPDIAPWSGLLC